MVGDGKSELSPPVSEAVTGWRPLATTVLGEGEKEGEEIERGQQARGVEILLGILVNNSDLANNVARWSQGWKEALENGRVESGWGALVHPLEDAISEGDWERPQLEQKLWQKWKDHFMIDLRGNDFFVWQNRRIWKKKLKILKIRI